MVGAGGVGKTLLVQHLLSQCRDAYRHGVCRVDLAPVSVQMLWPVRQDADPAHRWLRALVEQTAGTPVT